MIAQTPDRVLVVDDDVSVRALVARVVADAGYVVDTAADTSEAKLRLATGTFDLVICDLVMPGESGATLVAWIREEHPDVAVLMATGTDDPAIADAVIALGAYGYILKPFRRHEVTINVSNALHRRRLELENRRYRDELERLVSERTAALKETVLRLERSEVELVRTHETTINRFSLAIEFRSHETSDHVERIGHTAAMLGRDLGLDEQRCETIRLAAALHDVGKIGVPDSILLKPGALTDAERAAMQRHAELGHRLLTGSGSELLELAAEIAWTHHERFDGAGYPRGLSGHAIPLEGRVTAVADVFDALVHDRVYRPALPVDTVLEIMQGGRGGHFDPDVLDAFVATA